MKAHYLKIDQAELREIKSLQNQVNQTLKPIKDKIDLFPDFAPDLQIGYDGDDFIKNTVTVKLGLTFKAVN